MSARRCSSAYEYLCSKKNKNKKTKQLELKYNRRFFTKKPIFRIKCKDPWIRKVLLAYYQYFIAVLTKQITSEAEIQLAQSLAPCIPDNFSVMNLDQIEGQLEVLFKNKGYHFLGGLTGPFRGPFIWKTMEKREFKVELPNHSEEITVYFLSDFLLQSWRLGTLDDVANVAEFFASDLSSFVSGQRLLISGGAIQ